MIFLENGIKTNFKEGNMLKNFYFAILVTLGIFLVSYAQTQNEPAQLVLEKTVIAKDEKLCFSLKNTSNKVIYLPNTAPWVIIGKTGKYKGKIERKNSLCTYSFTCYNSIKS